MMIMMMMIMMMMMMRMMRMMRMITTHIPCFRPWRMCSSSIVPGFSLVCNFFFPRASERRVILIVEACHHIFSSSHLLIFTSSHLHIFILTSSCLDIFSSSHLLIFTSSHLLIFASSHLLSVAFLPSCPLALLLSCPLALFLSLALLLSCSFALLPFCPLAFLPSCSLALFSLLLFYFSLKARGSANEAPRNATLSHEIRSSKTEAKLLFKRPAQPFRTKWCSIVKNQGQIATFSSVGRNVFARNDVRSSKTKVKLRLSSVGRNVFARNDVRSSIYLWGKIATLKCRSQPFRAKWGSIVKNSAKIAFFCCVALPSVRKAFCVYKHVCVSSFVCQSGCV